MHNRLNSCCAIEWFNRPPGAFDLLRTLLTRSRSASAWNNVEIYGLYDTLTWLRIIGPGRRRSNSFVTLRLNLCEKSHNLWRRRFGLWQKGGATPSVTKAMPTEKRNSLRDREIADSGQRIRSSFHIGRQKSCVIRVGFGYPVTPANAIRAVGKKLPDQQFLVFLYIVSIENRK